MKHFRDSPELVVAGAADSSLEVVGPSYMVSSCAASEAPFIPCEVDPALVALLLVVVFVGDEGAAIMSTSSLASRSSSASGSILEARRFKGEEALSGNSAAPPIIARWWVVLVNGEVPLMVGWLLGALEYGSEPGVSAPRSLSIVSSAYAPDGELAVLEA